MLGAGQRNQRVRFERRLSPGDDGYGNPRPVGWSALLTCWAAFRPQFGREQMEAGRLESGLRGTLTVLAFAGTRAVTAADRAVFVAGPYAGRELQIVSVVPTPDGSEIEFALQDGVAT
jgi:head-tail adaptor